MRDVLEWFWRFAPRHVGRCPKPGWPNLTDPLHSQETSHFFTPWIDEFEDCGVTEQIAEAASIAVSQDKYPFPGGDHLQFFMKHVRSQQRNALAANEARAIPESREDCQDRSRDCPECYGQGFTSRKRESVKVADRNNPGQEIQTYSSISMFCLCPMGTFLARWYEHHDKPTYNRIRKLSQYPEIWNDAIDHPSWPRQPEKRAWPLELGWVKPEPLVVTESAAFFFSRVRHMLGNIFQSARNSD